MTMRFDNEPSVKAPQAFLHKPFDAADLLGAIELALTTPPED
jgi:hypothetical protein